MIYYTLLLLIINSLPNTKVILECLTFFYKKITNLLFYIVFN